MTVVELIKRLEEIRETYGDPNLEVVYDDDVGSHYIGATRLHEAEEDDPLDKPNAVVVVLSRR